MAVILPQTEAGSKKGCVGLYHAASFLASRLSLGSDSRENAIIVSVRNSEIVAPPNTESKYFSLRINSH